MMEVFLGITPAFAAQQAGQFFIEGIVKDKQTGVPLAGVRIIALSIADSRVSPLSSKEYSDNKQSVSGAEHNNVEHIRYGAVSNAAGRFTLRLPEGVYLIRASLLGYKHLPVSAQAKRATELAGEMLTLEMSVDAKRIEEVIVTGVASRTQKSVAEIAVARVDVATLTEGNTFQDLTQVLAGKVAGVQIAPSSGNVAGGVRFNVRSGGGLFGAGQPVIFVDGVRMDNSQIGFAAGGQFASTLADLNPDDIQSVEVLKGPASSALYGTSGSNGVVLITTKHGSRKPENTFAVEAKVIVGWNEPSRLFTPEQAVSYAEANALFQRGDIRQYNLSASGNTRAVNYFAGLDHRTEQGIFAPNAMERTSFRANIEAFPNERVRLKINTNILQNSIRTPQGDDNVYAPFNNTLGFNKRDVYSNAFGSNRPPNPQFALEQIENSISTQRFIGSAEVQLRPVDGLMLRALAGVDVANNTYREVFPARFPYIRIVNGRRAVEQRRLEQVNYDLSASYSFAPLDEISSTTIIGSQLFSRTRRGFNVAVQDFAGDLLDDIEAGRSFISADQQFSDEREAGVFVQQELAYKNIYFLSFGVRNDYASSVGAQAPSIFYPRISAAVRLDRLGIVPEQMNLAKLRIAYGQSGQLPGPLEGITQYWGPSQSGYGVGAVVQRIGNPALEPERIEELEFGVEVEYDDMYGIDMTYYMQNARNSIVDFINSPSTGLTANGLPRNVGSIRGWGFESLLYATLFRTADAELRLSLVWNYTDNRVEDIGGAQPIFAGTSRNVIIPGLSRSAFYLQRVIEPRFRPDGSYDYENGPRTDSVRSFIGTPIPLYTGSLTVQFRFLQDITLYAMAEAGLGHSLYNNTRMLGSNPARGANPEYNRLATLLGLPGNPAQPTSIRNLAPVEGVSPLPVGSAEYRAAAERFARLDHRQAFFANGVEPADFLRIREVSLSYNATRAIQALFGFGAVKSLIFGVSARNLALFTRYSGADVEVARFGARSLERGIDNYTLQQPRTVNVSLSVGL